MDDSSAVNREQQPFVQAEQVSRFKEASLEEAVSIMQGFANAWRGYENCPTALEAFMARLGIRSTSQNGWRNNQEEESS